ncbi:U11/U12 small nuclear ribonucleoprotein 25 kDa protein-like [Glandiceps talaboti]
MDPGPSSSSSKVNTINVVQHTSTDSVLAMQEDTSELSHKEAMEIVREGMKTILQDPLLAGLPTDVTPEEVTSQIALEYGQAMTVNVRKHTGETVPVVVLQGATVLDLKNAIKRHFTMKLTREGRKKQISWRYIWKTYWLVFDGERLSENHKKIKEYGIKNQSEVKFVKRYREN